MNTQFEALDTVRFHTHLQQVRPAAECADEAAAAAIPSCAAHVGCSSSIARLRATESFLKRSSTTPSASAELPRKDALAWAFKLSATGLLLLALAVCAIVWNDGQTASGSSAHQGTSLARTLTTTVNGSTPTPAATLQPSTSAFALQFGSARRSAPLTSSSSLSISTEVGATAWLRVQHEREQAAKIAASLISRAELTLNPIVREMSSISAQRRLLCDNYVPPYTFTFGEYFTWTQLRQGAVILHLILLLYLLLGWGVLWMNYVNPLARHLGLAFDLHTNKGEATLLAIAGCLPNFIMNFIAVFYTHRDFGTGTVLGSGIMNTFVIPIIIFVALPHIGFPVYWWRASRDLLCFSVAVLIMVAMTITGQQIDPIESSIMLVVLFAYCYVLKYDSQLFTALSQALYSAKKKQLRDKKRNKKKGNLQKFLEHPGFSHFITLCIMTSIVFVIWDSVGTQPWLTNANYGISAIFLLECAMKIICYTFLGYCSDPSNAFDGVLVILILFELIFGNGAVATSVRAVRLFRFLRALRGLRAVRAVRAARSNSFLRNQFHHAREEAAAADGDDLTVQENPPDDPTPEAFITDEQAAAAARVSNLELPASPSAYENAAVVAIASPSVASAVELQPIQSEPKSDPKSPKSDVKPVQGDLKSLLSSRRAFEKVVSKDNEAEDAGTPNFVTPLIFVTSQEEVVTKVETVEPTGSVVATPVVGAALATTSPPPLTINSGTPSATGSRRLHGPAVPPSPSSNLSRINRPGAHLTLDHIHSKDGTYNAPSRSGADRTTQSTPSNQVRGLVLERTDEETGEVIEELVVISGNAGATEEELANDFDEEDFDDDDLDDDDDVESEEDEDDHWDEMLAEENGKGPRGEVGEPILDAQGAPTGLIKVFVKGVEPRRWSALGPQWNKHRMHIGYFMTAMMTGMSLLIIAVNIQTQIQGTS